MFVLKGAMWLIHPDPLAVSLHVELEIRFKKESVDNVEVDDGSPVLLPRRRDALNGSHKKLA